jgi:ABC-type microcin C transport system permease subunit YejB
MQPNELVLPEVYDIWPSAFWQTGLGYGILSILSISVLVIVGILIYKLRKKSTTDRILMRLRHLLQERYTTVQDYQKVYSELSRMLKEYLMLIHADIPKGITDYELIQEIERKGYDKTMQSVLHTVMQHAQEVKFGHALFTQNQVKTDISHTILFITKTSVPAKV